MQQIQMYSRRIGLILNILLVLLPIATIYFWLTVQTSSDVLNETGIIQLSYDIDAYIHQPLMLQTRLWALLASALPCGILFYALVLLKKLFRSYENAEIFTLQTVKYYRQLGLVFFYWAIGGFIYSGLISVALSFNNPPGERVLSLSFSGLDVMAIFCGCIVLVISHVMHQAQQIADEQKHTI
ncbi:DUF2975 domain-containing protein [Vibrio sp. OCN044]|uniref:DUF2975 domain-containing protein n=1 Tax=Vibrio tetraodonis subsp. pristinus TaxID=2695891 RepID=A0A6L8LSS8_9VIBR|nr:DUF2975 domain-containing protein [Vibrio tetraodonis]MYM59151.1 DUF2975 domain-containing protein [Vibrio tetraodonis subsp. pristinus]